VHGQRRRHPLHLELERDDTARPIHQFQQRRDRWDSDHRRILSGYGHGDRQHYSDQADGSATVTISVLSAPQLSCNPTSGPVMVGIPYTAICTVFRRRARLHFFPKRRFAALRAHGGGGGDNLHYHGKPAAPGAYSYTVQVKDSIGQSATTVFQRDHRPGAFGQQFYPCCCGLRGKSVHHEPDAPAAPRQRRSRGRCALRFRPTQAWWAPAPIRVRKWCSPTVRPIRRAVRRSRQPWHLRFLPATPPPSGLVTVRSSARARLPARLP